MILLSFRLLAVGVFLFPLIVRGQNSQEISIKSMLDTSNAINIYPNYYLPLVTLRVTSSYGSRIHPVTGKIDFHRGVDLAAHSKLVFSVLPGVVSQVGYNATLGNYIRINHSRATSIYGHLSILFIKKDDLILGGQPIAITGSTGRVTGEHLHFSIRVDGVYVDPLYFLLSLKSE